MNTRVTVTTKIITFSVGEACKLSFTTVTGKEPNPKYIDVHDFPEPKLPKLG